MTHPDALPEAVEASKLRAQGIEIKNVVATFFRWWWNRPGSNTEQGYDEWAEGPGKELLSALITPAEGAESKWHSAPEDIAVMPEDDRPFPVNFRTAHEIETERLAIKSRPTAVDKVAETIETYFGRQIEWSCETFGPALRTKGVIDHIRKELTEIEDKPHDLSEWIDVVILAMDGFWRHGGSASTLLPALLAKQTKNMARTWPDWRLASEDRAIEHDRSADAPIPADKGAIGEEASEATVAGVMKSLKGCFDKPMRNIETFPTICRQAYAVLSALSTREATPLEAGEAEAIASAFYDADDRSGHWADWADLDTMDPTRKRFLWTAHAALAARRIQPDRDGVLNATRDGLHRIAEGMPHVRAPHRLSAAKLLASNLIADLNLALKDHK